MARDAYLSGQHDVAARLGTAGQAYLRAEQRVLTDFAPVAHLNQVVNLCPPAQARFAYGGAIDAGMGLHLNVILDHGGAGLHNLVIRTVILLGEAETIGPDNGAVLQGDTVADTDPLAHDGV